MFHEKPISDLIKTEALVALAPGVTVGEAARKMLDRHVGLVVVVENEAVVGIVTERDINFRVVARSRDAETTRLAEIMSRNPVLIAPETPVSSALKQVVARYFRYAVVGTEGRVAGVVPVNLIFAEITRALDNDIGDIDRYIQGEVLEAGA